MKKLNIMKNLLFTLALLVSFSSFGQLDSSGNEYNMPQPMLEFAEVEIEFELSKENLLKELKCPPVLLAGRKYQGFPGVLKQDLLLKVVSFDIFISGQEEAVAVKGNSIGNSLIAKNLLDTAKAGDFVVFSNVLVVGDNNFQYTINAVFPFKIIP